MKFKWWSVLFAVIMLVSTSATVFAAPQAPAQCTKGLFTWTCSSGSEKFANDPTPPISGLGGYGYFESELFSDTGFGGNAYVENHPGFALRFKTTQQFDAWWDAQGTMHVAERLNGVITIPSGAVIIAVPGDILGNFDLAGWVKGQLTTTGEYVLGSKAWLK